MDIRVLKNFMKIAENGSICKAAESLHISQPPLSRQLKSLEYELGTELFERSSKGVTLTKKGQLLYNRAASLISYNDLIVRELTADTNIIRLGMTTSLVDYSLEYMKNFRKDNLVNFEITEKNTFELLELLKNIMLDVVFIRTPFEIDSHFSSIKLEEDCLVALGKKHFFDKTIKNEISIKELRDMPIITVRRWKNFIDFAADVDNHTCLDYHFICDDNRTALSMAENGMGISILPSSVINNNIDDSLVSKGITNNDSLKTNIYMVFPSYKEMEPSVNKFINFVLGSPHIL